MDEFAYVAYIQRANKANEVYAAIREIYGWATPWREAYFMAIRDRLLSKTEKDLVKEFHPVK